MDSSEASQEPRQQIIWSDLIKSHHTQLRQHFEALANAASPKDDSEPMNASHAGANDIPIVRSETVPSLTSAPLSAADELVRWQRALQLPGEDQHRHAYARAMHNLATQYWAAGSVDAERDPDAHADQKIPPSANFSRHKRSRADSSSFADKRNNDRILYTLECLSSYFLGRLTDGSDSSYAESLPAIFSRAIKPLRQNFFRAHQRIATPAELDEMIDTMTRETKRSCPAWMRAVSYRDMCRPRSTRADDCEDHSADKTRAGREAQEALTPLRILDVGSCYGPFVHRVATHPQLGAVPLLVTSIDLQPYRDLDAAPDEAKAPVCSLPQVLKGDWLSIPFYNPQDAVVTAAGEARADTPATGAESFWTNGDSVLVKRGDDGTYTAEGLRVGAYDAVIFCLLLSYLPSPRLRFLACLHAFLALEEGGLLVVLSTRTQGSRRRPWAEEWTAALATIGFKRVHKSERGKIVGLTFARCTEGRPAVGPPVDGAAPAPWDSLAAQIRTAYGRRVWMDTLLRTPEAANGLTITADCVAAGM